MFKFTLTIATPAFLFMSGTANLFAMELLDVPDEKPGKQLVIAMKASHINHMTEDVLGVLFLEISKSTNPRHLTSLSKPWYRFMSENNDPQVAELHFAATNILHTAMNSFIQKCMHTYWDNLFYNGILQYAPADKNRKVIHGCPAVTLKFSDLKDGTFDLSKYGETGQCGVITENMSEFLKV